MGVSDGAPDGNELGTPLGADVGTDDGADDGSAVKRNGSASSNKAASEPCISISMRSAIM